MKSEFEELGVCVLIPTYNNEKTLEQVIRDVLEYCNDVIVVNDGSTDNTQFILSKFNQIKAIGYSNNTGKGYALQKGFECAKSLNFKYCISIDSDGQHKASDLPVFLNALKENPDALIVGARNMNQKGIPGKSSFGHRFSNFWFHFETGLKLPDTQSGFRLYPVNKISEFSFFTKKYEFEIEVLVKSVWNGIDVISCPIQVFYAEGKERITHFRPFKDFTRISILNTYLVLLAIIYYRPKLFFRSIKKKTLDKSYGSKFSLQMNRI